MAEKYALYDYSDCDYVEGNDCASDEVVKTFGFSQKDERILSTNDSQRLKNKQNKRYGRNSFVFPSQAVTGD
ncbi:MAG: hypothetical protein DRG78_07450 [Epsilonproteobacteria bacterium]|nr:MAG: hypothetical protein DRG78_07450 [Campylobacterota bacterium]